MKKQLFKKRLTPLLRPEAEFSRRLRRAQKRLQGDQPEEGLRQLDELSRQPLSGPDRCRLLGLIAEYEFHRGAFDRALELHTKAMAGKVAGTGGERGV